MASKFTVTSVINRFTAVIVSGGLKTRWMLRNPLLAAKSCMACGKHCFKGFTKQIDLIGKDGVICEDCLQTQLVTCESCGVRCPKGITPPPSSRDAWAEIATQHSGTCEFVRTRGQKTAPKPIVPRVWTKDGWVPKDQAEQTPDGWKKKLPGG